MHPTPRACVLALVAGAFLSGPVAACINETGTTRSGHQAHVHLPAKEFAAVLVTPGARTGQEVKWARVAIRNAREKRNFENLNDLAVVLMRFGKPREAAALLEQVERRFPGHWQTAPNLGTAYELAGDNLQALRWIREGIRRNPSDHGGSEWLHAAILEAKLARRGNVLALDFGAAPLPRRPAPLPAGNDGKPVTVQELAIALRVQLQERAYFVKAPDPLMAGMLFDLARLELVDGTMEQAEVAYAAASRYGHADLAAIHRGRAEAARVLKRADRDSERTVECPLCANEDPDRRD